VDLLDGRGHSLTALLHVAWGGWSEQPVSQKSRREGSCCFCRNKVVFAFVMVNWPAWAAESLLDVGLSQLTVVCWSQNQ